MGDFAVSDNSRRQEAANSVRSTGHCIHKCTKKNQDETGSEFGEGATRLDMGWCVLRSPSIVVQQCHLPPKVRNDMD